MRLSVEIWQRGGTWTFRAATTPLAQVVLNPTSILPDVNKGNNTWRPTRVAE